MPQLSIIDEFQRKIPVFILTIYYQGIYYGLGIEVCHIHNLVVLQYKSLKQYTI